MLKGLLTSPLRAPKGLRKQTSQACRQAGRVDLVGPGRASARPGLVSWQALAKCNLKLISKRAYLPKLQNMKACRQVSRRLRVRMWSGKLNAPARLGAVRLHPFGAGSYANRALYRGAPDHLPTYLPLGVLFQTCSARLRRPRGVGELFRRCDSPVRCRGDSFRAKISDPFTEATRPSPQRDTTEIPLLE